MRSRWFRRIVVWCVLLGAFIGAWRFGGPVWHHARVLWWQRTCMAYAQPAERVVYSDRWRDVQSFAGRADYGQNYVGGPVFFRELPAYQGLSAEVGHDAGSGGAVAFMHERTNERGQRRLVIVYVAGDPFRIFNIDEPGLKVSVWIPASVKARGSWAPTQGYARFASGVRVNRRVFAGQVDPADASAFTIRCDVSGAPRTLRGKLVGDTVQFSVE